MHLEEHSAPHDDETWLVSYADLVTILMGFFVIMYSMAAPDEKKVQKFGEQISSTLGKSDLGSSPLIATPDMQRSQRVEEAYRRMLRIAGLSGEPEAVVQQLKKLDTDERSRRAMAEQFRDVMVSTDLDSIVPGKDSYIGPKQSVSSFSLPERMLFGSGSSNINIQSSQSLRRLAKILAASQGVKVEVLGHTDSTQPSPGSPLNNNWALSSARAGAVADILIKAGVRPEQISVRGMADTELLTRGTSAADREMNRRVEIRILERF
jgi:chemotaxis protein MotB